MARFGLLALITLLFRAAADSFLAKSPVVLSQEDVKQMLLSELKGHKGASRLGRIEKQLEPMFATLPKNAQGRLEPATVRYALDRYFLHQYGWYVQGLDQASGSWNSSETTLLKARAPAFIQSLFEEHLREGGMALHELAVFAAVLADLIHTEAAGQLEWIFSALRLPMVGSLEATSANAAIDAFVVAFALGGNVVATTPFEIQELRHHLAAQYPNLDETKMWVEDLQGTHELELSSRTNPFVQPPISFDSTRAFVLEFSHRFGSFQNLECHTLKRKLTEVEHEGSGRVLLSQFYSTALAGTWEFMESVEYLRNQGALDETDPEHPSVVIPNYLNSRMNCLTASEFYAVCCLNECDELLGKIEAHIASPNADPSDIVGVVSGLQSDTVDAPRNLSSALLSRLNEISQTHGGQVPLHGRLFAQWLHHAYPRECPFPHTTGSVEPMYPMEFAERMGGDLLEVSQEVMEAHAMRLGKVAAKPLELPWIFEEELLAEHQIGESSLPSADSLRRLFAMVALASLAASLLRALKVASGSPCKSSLEKHLV